MTKHDPLVYLPRARVQEFAKQMVIYDGNRPPDHLYLVISGRIRIFYTAPDGTQMLLRLVSAEQFFGETSLLMGDGVVDECAAAMENAQVMAWTPEEIENQIHREPLLGVALVEYCAANNLVLQERLAALATLKTGTRVALSLIQLAQSLGKPMAEGNFRIRGMTHQAIADYAGTSREIVTSELNRLRRLGLLAYSRGHMDVSPETLTKLVREELAAQNGNPRHSVTKA
jgi:CRP/FNR family transcriptional regulator, cyclic AMP receptor protein